MADTAEILRMVARMLGDMMNYRVQVTQDMQQIFSAVVRLRADLDNARYVIGSEVNTLIDIVRTNSI